MPHCCNCIGIWCKTVNENRTYNDENGGTTTYNYSYNAAKSLLYFSFKSYSGTADDGTTYSYSNVSEYQSVLNKYGSDMTSEEKADAIESFRHEISKVQVYKYEISENSLTLTDYFTGTLPSDVYFRYSSGDGSSIQLDNDYLFLDEWTYDDFGDFTSVYGQSVVNFSVNTFSETVFKSEYNQETQQSTKTEIGTVFGTYSVSGEGTSGTVTQRFTSVPSVYTTQITTGSDYILKQSDSAHSETYTLKK